MYLDKEPQTIVIIDIGASSTRMYLVEVKNVCYFNILLNIERITN